MPGWNLLTSGGVDLNVPFNMVSTADTASDPTDAGNGFDEFYRSEFLRTVRLARLLTGRVDIAEDLAHEAFVRVHRITRPIDNRAAYLHTVTVNVCRSWHRGVVRETDRMSRVGASAESHQPHLDELTAVVAALPYRQRAVLVFRYWMDLSEAEIADRLGCRAGTVKSLHSRALATIRSEISE